MTGSDLISKILLELDTYLSLNNTELQDLIQIDEDLEEAAQSLLATLAADKPLYVFVQSLLEIVQRNTDNFLDDTFNLPREVSVIDFSADLLKKNRRFCYSDVDFGFVSSKCFFEDDILIDFSDDKHSLAWKQVAEYLAKRFDDNDNSAVHVFFNTLRDYDKTKGFILNKTTHNLDIEQQYSYIYLAFLNSSQSISIESELTYTIPQLNSSLQYDNTKNYDQYFDIYDVINELNQAPDILNRFLRLYHVLEYMTYRVYLVDLVSRVGGSKLFVREFISSSESMKKSEKESFLKNFKKIFNNDIAEIKAGLNVNGYDTGSIKSFLKEKKIIDNYSSRDLAVLANLIYSLRCCIVHNKESEYHITTSNSEDYSVIIPLIKKLLEVFERLIISKISTNSVNIHYPCQEMKLY